MIYAIFNLPLRKYLIMNYLSFTYLKNETPLAAFFNHIMKGMSPFRSICAPDTFRRDEDIAEFQDSKFCDICRYELLMHRTVVQLEDWRNTITSYFTDYGGHWKYYASSRWLDFIDGIEEAEPPTDYTSDEDFKPYCITTELLTDDIKTVFDTTLRDVLYMCTDIITMLSFDMPSSLKRFGFPVYKEGKYGNAYEASDIELQMDSIARGVEAEDDCKRVKGVFAGIWGLKDMHASCIFNDNNEELLQMMLDAIHAIFAMDFSTLHLIFRKYQDRYANDLHNRESTH